MQIYFDGNLINSIYYAGLTKTSQLYTDSLKLGSTLCETYKLTLGNDGFTSIPSVITIIYENKTRILYIDSYNSEDDTTTFVLNDYMKKANFSYDASPLMEETGKTTLGHILDDICLKIGITNGISDFYMKDMEVSWYNNNISARDYLGFIAEINASYFYLDNNTLKMSQIKKDISKEINMLRISRYKVGLKHKITRVVWDDGANKWEFGDSSGETYYINTSNVYVISEEIVENIYNSIKDFEFYNFMTDNCPLESLETGDIVSFVYENINYTTIAQFPNEIDFFDNKWNGGLELEINSQEKNETKVLGTEKRLKHLETIVNRDENTITQIVSQTNDLSEIVNNNTIAINNNKQEVLDTLNNTASKNDLIELQSTMMTRLDSNSYEINNIKRGIENGVEKVITTSGKFDENGLTMQKTGAETQTILNQLGVDVQNSSGNDILYAGYVDDAKAEKNPKLQNYKGQTIAYAENIVVDNYMTIGTHSRIEDYEDGTGIFSLI